MVFPGNKRKQPRHGFPDTEYSFGPAYRRPGYLGALLRGLLGLLFVAAVTLFLLDAVFAPWAFYMGGHQHLLPSWQGWGRMRAPSAGGDYFLYLRMTPAPSGPARESTFLRGDAYVCTPGNQRYHLFLFASMPRNLLTEVTEEPIHISVYQPVSLMHWETPTNGPHFDLHGTWTTTGLTLDDDGTLTRAFAPAPAAPPLPSPPAAAERRKRNVPPAPPSNAHADFHSAPYFVFRPTCPPDLSDP